MANSGMNWTQVEFTKSSYSGSDQGNCVEFGTAAGLVGIRDSKLAEASPILEVEATAFRAFITDLKAGTFDQSA
ncbi:DUF397 domain-containing protein [Saccharopolyspora sp. HNM0983]|uniref:DUF397 domain-containing protein n=1 Tax=Saccharopolyspora montiporae TaxID=2781240 RepID=A0A929FZ64_9PSEU|nr:DUF397 domain-containing protein [Saccharopolyspora sp. HNM0983]MBE9376551.1 DUF397 domain-containing protein [Saccharopolyspora sp. HNM0983]